MKLFNEEQLQEAYNRGHMDGRLNNTDYSIIERLKSIELPSDEEIKEEVDNHIDYGGGCEGWIKDGWRKVAKWMKNQILNQNK